MSDLAIFAEPTVDLPELFDLLAAPPPSTFRSSVKCQHRGELWMFVRLATNVWAKHHGYDFVIASVDAENRGAGALTRLLDAVEPRFDLAFESVVNPRLRTYLERRGYQQYPANVAPWEATHYTRRKS